MIDVWGFVVKRGKAGQYAVFLPHQCQSWDIAGEGDVLGCVDHATALQELESFIAEGQRALSALRAGQEYGNR